MLRDEEKWLGKSGCLSVEDTILSLIPEWIPPLSRMFKRMRKAPDFTRDIGQQEHMLDLRCIDRV